MTPEEHEQAVYLLGPWLIGSAIDILLQGIIIVQVAHYFNWYRDDDIPLKLAVAVLALITSLKSIQSFALLWIQFIDHFADLEAAVRLSYTTWWQSGNPLMVASIGLYVQTYFVWRLFMISGRSWLPPLVLAPIFLLAYAAIAIATFYISQEDEPAISRWFATHLSCTFSGDILLSTTTAYYLIQSRQDVLPQTVGLLNALIRLTFTTAAPAAVCAMLNLIFSQLYDGTDRLVSTAFNQAIPKLYATSMMWTLNARRRIRAEYESGRGGMNLASYSSHAGPAGRSRGVLSTTMEFEHTASQMQPDVRDSESTEDDDRTALASQASTSGKETILRGSREGG
ncbi:hypothetical protein BD626DRAFT_563957 [Schizophyllum amplum]|uniref:DUF6534 domain-containing protein n=1 Tax=Schizophyllum amplum TaxID=97359 RepID=A0A550CZT3_9AGAR|nr:hypothetical protein BD626DRAFT_563957 [Auriculariopsis ampla]